MKIDIRKKQHIIRIHNIRIDYIDEEDVSMKSSSQVFDPPVYITLGEEIVISTEGITLEEEG